MFPYLNPSGRVIAARKPDAAIQKFNAFDWIASSLAVQAPRNDVINKTLH
ncbi:MAG: hypothetical protein LBK53_04255 [Heliobacteriaceae bacterium]|nr:hypothetical protein [Heliobacteriaceae bacterium]